MLQKIASTHDRGSTSPESQEYMEQTTIIHSERMHRFIQKYLLSTYYMLRLKGIQTCIGYSLVLRSSKSSREIMLVQSLRLVSYEMYNLAIWNMETLLSVE